MGRSLSVKTLKKTVWDKTGGVCAHCGRPANGRKATIDHFIPRALGGGSDKRNLMPLCVGCNIKKSDNDMEAVSYYKFAPEWAVRQCLNYKEEWESGRRSLDGTTY